MMAANGNNNIRRIIRGTYTGDEIPELHPGDRWRWLDGLNLELRVTRFGVILPDVTHLTVDRSITVIPGERFVDHPSIEVLVCHENVKKIEGRNNHTEAGAFYKCPRLERVVMNGVEEAGWLAFTDCRVLTHVKCLKLEIVGNSAFEGCISLRDIDMPSARIVKSGAFYYCKAMKYVTFGKDLESIRSGAFKCCYSLERITIPLKNDLFPDDDILYGDTFQGCENLRRVTLVEVKELEETAAELLLQEWRDDMIEAIYSINRNLPDASAGDDDYSGEKTMVIREWISSVLRKIIDYKAQHRRLLNEVVTSTFENVLPNDIVLDSVLPFLQLPPYTFDGEEEEGAE